jgi:hypothetical protein
MPDAKIDKEASSYRVATLAMPRFLFLISTDHFKASNHICILKTTMELPSISTARMLPTNLSLVTQAGLAFLDITANSCIIG